MSYWPSGLASGALSTSITRLPPDASKIVFAQASWVWTMCWLGPAQYAIFNVCFWAAAGPMPEATNAKATNAGNAVLRCIASSSHGTLRGPYSARRQARVRYRGFTDWHTHRGRCFEKTTAGPERRPRQAPQGLPRLAGSPRGAGLGRHALAHPQGDVRARADDCRRMAAGVRARRRHRRPGVRADVS